MLILSTTNTSNYYDINYMLSFRNIRKNKPNTKVCQFYIIRDRYASIHLHKTSKTFSIFRAFQIQQLACRNSNVTKYATIASDRM